jgi:sporulation protein YlmC with PRC-barrel domain
MPNLQRPMIVPTTSQPGLLDRRCEMAGTTTTTPGRLRLAVLGDGNASVVAAEDVRGFELHDVSAERIGSVEDVVVDETGRVRFLKVGSGGVLGLGRAHRLVPVDVIDNVAGESVFLKVGRDDVLDAPDWQPVDDPSTIERVCVHFGCQPFWADGYRAPDWTEPS